MYSCRWRFDLSFAFRSQIRERPFHMTLSCVITLCTWLWSNWKNSTEVVFYSTLLRPRLRKSPCAFEISLTIGLAYFHITSLAAGIIERHAYISHIIRGRKLVFCVWKNTVWEDIYKRNGGIVIINSSHTMTTHKFFGEYALILESLGFLFRNESVGLVLSTRCKYIHATSSILVLLKVYRSLNGSVLVLLTKYIDL